MLIQYYIEDFLNCKIKNIIFNEEILQRIANIVKEVGCPSYKKTPNFNRKNIIFKKRQKTNELSDEVIIFNKISLLLNKINKKNIIDSINSLIVIINENLVLKDKIIILIHKIIIPNNFLLETFIYLYINLYEKQIITREDTLVCFRNLEEDINTIKYTDPNENYDLFCLNNEINTRIKNSLHFFLQLLNKNIFEKEFIIKLILKIQKKLLEMIKDKDKINISSQLTMYIFILVHNNNHLKDDDSYNIIKQNIEKIKNLKRKEYPGLTKKIIFKHMDIILI